MPTLSGPEYLNGQFSVAADGTVSLTTTPVPIGGGSMTGPLTVNGQVSSQGTSAGLVFRDRVTGDPWQWYSSGSDTAHLNYNGASDFVVVSNTGNVGIGTTTPRAMLDVNGIAAMSNNLYVQNAANGAVGLVPGDIGNTGYVEWLLPSASLGGGTRVAYMGYNLAGRISLTLAAATSFIVGNASSDFLAVAASGNVGIGTISPGSLLTVNGTCANVSGAWTTISDASVKENVQPYTRGLDAIAALKPVEFCYAAGTPFAEADKPSRQLFGLIADEVKPHVPEIVGTTTATVGKKEGVELSTLEPGNLIYALINSCKELAAKNSALETRIAALESATVH